MPNLIASRMSNGRNLFPMRAFLDGPAIPYSYRWYDNYFIANNDVGGTWNGSGGQTATDILHKHECYRAYTNCLGINFARPGSMLDMFLSYVYARVLRQVEYYNLPHNPSIPSYYQYFRHLESILKDEDDLLKKCLQDWIALCDRVYAAWPVSYQKKFGWNPNEDLSKYNAGVSYGFSGVVVPEWPEPPIVHPLWDENYVEMFGPQETSFDENYHENDVYVPLPTPAPDPTPTPEPVPDDPVVIVPQPTPPMPTPNRQTTPAVLSLLQSYWAKYLNETASIAEQRYLVAYGVIDAGAMYTGQSRREKGK